MTTRTFIQQGQGYGIVPVEIVAKIDGNVVFSGAVPTTNPPVPPGGTGTGSGPTQNLFSWTNDVTFAGQQSVEITVTGGTLLMTQTVANYTKYLDGTGNTQPGNETTYTGFWTEVIDGITISDPFINEAIDGVLQIEHPEPGSLDGQWWWYVPNNGVFTAILNVAAGNVAP